MLTTADDFSMRRRVAHLKIQLEDAVLLLEELQTENETLRADLAHWKQQAEQNALAAATANTTVAKLQSQKVQHMPGSQWADATDEEPYA